MEGNDLSKAIAAATIASDNELNDQDYESPYEYSYCDEDNHEDEFEDDGDNFYIGKDVHECASIDDQLKEVVAKYGDGRVAFCRRTSADNPHAIDTLYMFFPLDSSNMESLGSDFGDIWGFDPTTPIVLRMNVFSPKYFDDAPLHTKNEMAVRVYQNIEPPQSWDVTKLGKGEKGVAKNATEQNEEKDKIGKNGGQYNLHSEKKMKHARFRLGDQLKRIAEDFLVANWKGFGRKESVLSLPIATKKPYPDPISRACSRCTYVTHDDGAESCEMCGYSLKMEIVTQSPDFPDQACNLDFVDVDQEDYRQQQSGSCSIKACRHCNYVRALSGERFDTCPVCGLSDDMFTDLEQSNCSHCTSFNPITSDRCDVCGGSLKGGQIPLRARKKCDEEEKQQRKGFRLMKACQHCTYVGTFSNACLVCGSNNNVVFTEENRHDETSQSNCPHCTSLNPITADQCNVCGSSVERDPKTTGKKQKRNESSSNDSHEQMLKPLLEKACSSGNGLLVRLYTYMMERIPRLHHFCVICDQPHLFHRGIIDVGAPAIRPSVCRRDLCSWSFCELGVGRTSTDRIATAGEVVDLILAITISAATSARAKQILNPFPSVMDADRRKILDPKRPDYAKAAEMVKGLPSFGLMVACEKEEEIRRLCEQRSKHSYGLLQWIVSSCPAHIVCLQGKDRIVSMGTTYQYLMRCSSPEHDRVFDAAKQSHGSIFAFHGSPIENWHAILRNGVKNCSGTSLQLNGASYGAGVYVSPTASMSLKYSQIQSQSAVSAPAHGRDNEFVSDKEIRLLALCEIVDDGNCSKSGDVWVVRNDKHIVTRFLFAFVPSTADFDRIYRSACGCRTTEAGFRDELVRSVQRVASSTNGTY